MENKKTTPIFVIGSIRSGTTYLGNILAASNSIAAVQYTDKYGVHESSYFNHIYGRYGNIKNWSHYVEFVEATINSDYFRLAGINKKELYELYPASYGDVFRFVMDRLAIKEEATYWVEKSPNHALELDLISQCYPDALFIAIKRDIKSVIKSAMGLTFIYEANRKEDVNSRLNIISEMTRNYYRTYKSIASFSKKNKGKLMLINYEDLVANYDGTTAKIKEFININGDLNYNNQYTANSSFKKGESLDSFYTKQEISKLKRLSMVYKKMPLLFFVWKDRLRKFIFSKTNFFSPNTLPSWFYRSYEFKKPNY